MRSLFFVAADIIGLNIALIMAYYIRFDFSFQAIYEEFITNLPVISLITVTFKIFIFYAFRLYKSLWRYAGAYEVVNVAIASLVANAFPTLFLLVQYALTGNVAAPRSIFALTALLDVYAVGGIRMLYRIYRRKVLGTAIDYDKVRRVLIVGAGDAGAIIAQEMRRHPELLQKPVAFIDNDSYKIGSKLNGIPILGDDKKIPEIVRRERINEIILAIPHAKPAKLNMIYAESANLGCRIRILPSMSQIIDESVVMQKVKDVDIEDLLGRDIIRLDVDAISSYLSRKIILVTGAGGSIGSELCRQIALFSPEKLIMLDNYENNLHDVWMELQKTFPNLNLYPVIASIRDAERLNEVFEEYCPNIVFHAAAHKHVPLMEWHPEEAIKNNVLGTWNLIHSAEKTKVDRFVLISSDKAVNPTNVMGATKRVAEMMVQAMDSISRTEYVAVRFGNVLGSNGSVIPLFRRQIESGGPVTVTHADMTRYFMAIPEAAQLVMQAGAYARGGEIFILDMGQPVRILDLAENMIRLSGYEPYEDIPVKFIGLRPGEKLFEELLMTEEGIEKTVNEKIYVAKPLFKDYDLLEKEIALLQYELENSNSKEDKEIKVTEFLKQLVPSYTGTIKIMEKADS